MIIEQLTEPLPGSLMPTLSGSYYHDPAVFALEQEQIFEVLDVRGPRRRPGQAR